MQMTRSRFINPKYLQYRTVVRCETMINGSSVIGVWSSSHTTGTGSTIVDYSRVPATRCHTTTSYGCVVSFHGLQATLNLLALVPVLVSLLLEKY